MAAGITNPPYYLSAYGIAVKHGYVGTEEQWNREMWENARQSAANAAASEEGAAAAKVLAESARDLAAAWAAGTEPGEPGATNNAAYYAAQASAKATTANNRANDAEAWAKGTRGGSAVTVADPAYHNNAKYYNDNIVAAIAEAAGAWLTEHVDPETEFTIDDTLSVAGAAADAKATGDADAAITDAMRGVLDGMNVQQSLVDYGYGLGLSVAEESTSAIQIKRIGLQQDFTRLTLQLSNPTPNGYLTCKISGGLDRASTVEEIAFWTTGIPLISGHKYRVKTRLMSDPETTIDTTGVTKPQIVVIKAGAAANVATTTYSGYDSDTIFTADVDPVNLCLRVWAGTTLINAVYLVVLEDMTARSSAISGSLLVPEGTAW